MQSLANLHKIQNKIYIDDLLSIEKVQPFLYFLGNHPHLFRDFIQCGQLTNAEMNYIITHFNDYEVDPRTFENEFTRAMIEALPRYNQMKKIEIQDELYELFDDKYTKEIITNRLTELEQNGTKETTGTNTSEAGTKNANRELPMATTGEDFDGTVSWADGASGINESKENGKTSIDQKDIDELKSKETGNDKTTESFKREKSPVETIDKIWNYLLKTKAIEYLTQELSYAFNLVY